MESVEFFNLDQVVEYTGLLENATTAAKVEQEALAQYGRVLSKSADERIDSRRYTSTLATSGYLSGYWM